MVIVPWLYNTKAKKCTLKLLRVKLKLGYHNNVTCMERTVIQLILQKLKPCIPIVTFLPHWYPALRNSLTHLFCPVCLLAALLLFFLCFVLFSMQMSRNQKKIVWLKCSIQEDVTVTRNTHQKITVKSIEPFKHQRSMAGPLHLTKPLLVRIQLL